MHNIFCATLLYCKQGTNDTNTVQIYIFLNKKKFVKTFYSELHWKKRVFTFRKKGRVFLLRIKQNIRKEVKCDKTFTTKHKITLLRTSL